MYSGDTGSHLQEHQACPRGDGCVYVCHESDKEDKIFFKKKAMTAKPKTDRLREVLILTFIFLPPFHLDGQRFTGYKVHKHKALLFFYQEMLKYH